MTDLFAALNIATGKVIGKTAAQHRAEDFKAFGDDLDRQVSPDLAVHVVCDNLSARKALAVHRWLLRTRGLRCISPDVRLVAHPGGAVVC